MKNIRFILLVASLLVTVFATMLIVRNYNPAKKLQMLEQEELAERNKMKSLLAEAFMYFHQKNYNSAEKRLHLFMRQSSRDITALQLLGNVFMAQGKHQEAEKVFRDVIKWDSPRSINFNNLGQCLAMQGKYYDAIPELKKAAILDPEAAQPHLNLAEVYIRLNVKKGALNELKKAFEIEKRKNSITISLSAFNVLKDDKDFQQLININAQKEVEK